MSVVAHPPALKIHADDRLAETIRDLLHRQFRAARSRLDVEADSGVVTLRGVATSFYQKQLWLHATWQCPEVERIDDQIRVIPDWE